VDKNIVDKDILDLEASPNDLIKLWQAGIIDQKQYQSLMKSSNIAPSALDWRNFLQYFIASLGALFLMSGVIFFFAYNWADLSKVQKFSLLQVSIVLLAVFIIKQGVETHAGKLAVVAVAVLLGVLMAVFGQTYQTGADPYELFTAWACIIFPMALVVRFQVLWILWLLIANIAISLYVEQGLGEHYSVSLYAKLGFLFNGAYLLTWELLAAKRFKWMRKHFTTRLVFAVCLLFATMLMLETINLFRLFRFDEYSLAWKLLNIFIYLLTLVVSGYYYQRKKRDLSIAAMTLFSVGTVSIFFIVKFISFRLFGFITVGTIIVMEAMLSVAWLRKKQLEWSIKS